MDAYERIKQLAIRQLDQSHNVLEDMEESAVRNYLTNMIDGEVQSTFDEGGFNGGFEHPREVVRTLLDDLLGLGPIDDLLRDQQVSEIMVNRFDTVFVERGGKLKRSPVNLESEQRVRQIIDRIVTPLGRRIDESSPMVDARLACGSRVNAIIPPLAVDGSSLTIRKFSKKQLTLDDLVQSDSCSAELADILPILVTSKFNILVSGGTGSGKTTLLNILSSFIPGEERIVTVEDAAELQVNHSNLVRLEARPANQEGEGEVSIRKLVVNALRMRPDRIIVGECRASESLDMLQAMNTGHCGSMTTIHANTCRDALRRLETLVLMSGMELPINAIRQQMTSAIHFVLQVSRTSEGKRRIESLCEVQGSESNTIQLAELFKRDPVSQKLIPTGEVSLLTQVLPESYKARIISATMGAD
ncbi:MULTISPECIES: CpaF family protein [Gammaproteobacteria]|uniref:CpaF family protein n=1 Tax=Gammaproteobacteria TaxID=1236 RepID=UPI000DCF6B8D|nr:MULTISPECIES: CpaF family protein [Gammaproteobacteria]RTE87403.1 CpaF family protein [Aliidiomarina sp. B3213]TCZ92811.1 CpaF family protein [Lysobacter sp. N42]